MHACSYLERYGAMTDALDQFLPGALSLRNSRATTAEGAADFPKGNYDISVTWDDAVRVYVDNKLVLDEWKPSYYPEYLFIRLGLLK